MFIRYDEKCFSFKSMAAFSFYVFLFYMSVCAFCKTKKREKEKAQSFFFAFIPFITIFVLIFSFFSPINVIFPAFTSVKLHNSQPTASQPAIQEPGQQQKQ